LRREKIMHTAGTIHKGLIYTRVKGRGESNTKERDNIINSKVSKK
jgi:hypothetical protein